jgi:hypothetical protein
MPKRRDTRTDGSGADAAAGAGLAAIGEAEQDERYAFGNLPLDPVRPGTALLVVTPAAVDLPSRRLLAAGNPDEGIVGVAARSSPRRFLHSLSECADASLVQPHVGVLGCMGSATPRIRSFPETHLRSVSSPADLTGIGMRFSDLYASVSDAVQVSEQERTPQVRACLDSLTVLSQYVESRTLYRFLNAFNGRVRSAGMFGVVTASRDAHDERDIGRFAGLFDGILDVRETETGLEARVRGLPRQSRGWQAFH